MRKIRLQMEFRPALPVVIGNKDYRQMRELAERIDDVLTRSGLEAEMIEKVLGPRQAVSAANWARAWQQTQIALRCTIARHLTIKAHRVFSARLADSPLWQWFCRIDRLESVRVPSKSALQRYEAQWSAAEIRGLVQQLNQLAAQPAGAEQLGLISTLDVGAYFADTTCVKAHIHFPVDWVLLRDAARTLIKGTLVIRKHGLRQRMPEPAGFLRQMNRLSIAMTQGRRRPDSRRERKRVLRQMKRLSQVIRRHAQRHVTALRTRWTESDLTEGQAAQIIRRMENVLIQLPAAIKQAHERLIGGRPVANADKLLSLYERDLHVLVRGKADAEVEFGNTLFLAEQGDGLIVDWKLHRELSPGDGTLLDERSRWPRCSARGLSPPWAEIVALTDRRPASAWNMITFSMAFVRGIRGSCASGCGSRTFRRCSGAGRRRKDVLESSRTTFWSGPSAAKALRRASAAWPGRCWRIICGYFQNCSARMR